MNRIQLVPELSLLDIRYVLTMSNGKFLTWQSKLFYIHE